MRLVKIKSPKELKDNSTRSSYKHKRIGGQFGIVLEEKKRGWYRVILLHDWKKISVRSSEIELNKEIKFNKKSVSDI